MNVRIAVFALLACCATAAAESAARISISDLLRPETGVQAFHQFRRRTKPSDTPKDLLEFAQFYGKFRLCILQGSGAPPRYLIQYQLNVHDDEWDTENSNPSLVLPRADVLIPSGTFYYQIFTGEGESVADSIAQNPIADVDGDGEPEIVDSNVFTMASQPSSDPDSLHQSAEKRTEVIGEFLQVRSDPATAEAKFAVLYNTHPKDRAVGNTWGFQLRDDDGDGQYDIELGPVQVQGGVHPEVVFHWDKDTRTWVFPAPKAGDHFRVLTGPNTDEVASRILAEGGLGYQLVDNPPPRQPAIPIPSRDTDEISPELLSRPYRYQSLKGLSNEELVRYMAEGSTVWDFIREQTAKLIAAPAGFWSDDPRHAALAYVQANRPPPLASKYLLAIFNPRNEVAPTEGDITLSDAPSGCFAPGGAFIHHLHCTRERSFLIYAERIERWYDVPLTEHGLHFDFRMLDMSYDDARHLLQTIWWMTRIRSRVVVDGESAEYGGGGSTSDGFAGLQIKSDQGVVSIDAIRLDDRGDTFRGVGRSDGYDTTALIDLVVQIFHREVESRFGESWRAQTIPTRWNSALNAPEPHTSIELEHLKGLTRDFLQLYQHGNLSAVAATQAVEAVGAMGAVELKGELEATANAMPGPLPCERRIAEIEAQLTAWKKKLGAQAGEEAYRERQRPAYQTDRELPPIPGLELPTPDSPAVPPKPPPAKSKKPGKFAGVDALYEERERVLSEAPSSDRDVAELRQAIPRALRQLATFDDAEKLFQWGLHEPRMERFAVSRLAKIDAPRACLLLKSFEAKETNREYRESISASRRNLEAAISGVRQSDRRLSPAERTRALAVLSDGDAPYQARENALSLLVPPTDPKRYGDQRIDTALTRLLEGTGRSSKYLPAATPMALAQRRGSKAWAAISVYGQNHSTFGLSNLHLALPALTFIARREPDPAKSELRDLLAAELQTSYGNVNGSLWSIWQLDLRDLRPRLEEIATLGPSDHESQYAGGGGNQRLPLKHRFHLARQIVALWNEEDPLTRAKMYVAFANARAAVFSGETPDALDFLMSQLPGTLSTLDSDQRRTLVAFVGWCDENVVAKLESNYDRERVKGLQKRLRLCIDSSVPSVAPEH